MGVQLIQDLAVVMLVAGVVALVCKRLQLSIVVGFLLAGVVIGPYTPPFQLVSDVNRVQMLAELGLVFLIFAIGLDLNLKRLQRLGVSIALATVVSSILLLNFARLFGLVLGWTGKQSLFLAGMLMVSSSAIISKILEERGLTHERSAQLALGMTVLEDVAAVSMLTVLTSVVQFGEVGAGQLLPTLGSLAAFVGFLFLTALMVVPRFLTVLDRIATQEMKNILVVGMLLFLAWLAVKVGYSAALSAFVFGAIVGGTRHKRSVERALEGLRQIFGAVFFVSMGMLLDLRLLIDSLPLVALVSACAVLARVTTTTIGLVSVGTSLRDALRAGLNLTPIGEFSFIIAQLGVSTGAVPPSLYPVAVGMSLVTALVGPVLTRHSETLSSAIEQRTPRFVLTWIDAYHERLSRGLALPTKAEIIRTVSPALLYILFMSALLLASSPVYAYAEETLGEDFLFPGALKVSFGILLGGLLLAPLIGTWRRLSEFAELIAGGVNPFVAVVIRIMVAFVLAGWLIPLLPFDVSLAGSLIALVAALAVIGGIAWPHLNRWHARVEEELNKQIHAAQSPPSATELARTLKERPTEWGLRLEEIALPDQTPHAGRTIAELAIRQQFGCSIVGIERRGFSILNPSRDEVVYSGDRLLMLGTPQQIDDAEAFLRKTATQPDSGGGFDELTIESHMVPEQSQAIGRSLIELDLINRFGVQIGGIERAGTRLTSPTGSTAIEKGDHLLVIGTPRSIRDFTEWLAPPAAE